MATFKSFFKMLFSFAPWIAFLLIARNSMFQLKVGIVVAAILTIVMAVARLHRGVIMWVGMAFFGYAIVFVVFLNNVWSMRHMGVLANGSLALGTWLGLICKHPFTLAYARENTAPSLWNNPQFLRTNYLLTGMWAVVFSVNAFLAWQRSVHPIMASWIYETVNYFLLVGAMFLSTWYPEHKKHQRKVMDASMAG